MRLVVVLAALLGAPPAFAQLGVISLNRTVTQGDLKVTLERVTVTGPAQRRRVVVLFRVTDRAGRPVTAIRRGRVRLVEAGLASDPLMGDSIGDPARLTLFCDRAAPQSRLDRVRTVTLDVLAGAAPPDRVWKDVVVAATRSAARPAAPYQRRGRSVRLMAVYRSRPAGSALLGGSSGNAVTAEVTETVPGGTQPRYGQVRIEGAGLSTIAGAQSYSGGGPITYETTASARRGTAPARVTVRYYAGESLERALVPYHLKFANLRLQSPPGVRGGR